MRKTTQLRTLINDKEILLLPGIYDALSARIAERVGHKAITIGGYAMTGSLLAEPDSSQLSLTEMADHYARVCAAVEVPCLVDGDTGFGNVTNVRRTVREFERAGVAGLFIEAPRSVDDMRRICREAPFPQLANMISFGLTPELAARELQELGYAAAAWPVASIFAVTHTLQ